MARILGILFKIFHKDTQEIKTIGNQKPITIYRLLFK